MEGPASEGMIGVKRMSASVDVGSGTMMDNSGLLRDDLLDESEEERDRLVSVE